MPATQHSHIIEIKPNTSINRIISIMQENNINIDKFYALVYFKILSMTPKSGQYEIQSNISQLGVLRKIHKSKQIMHQITIPEGLTKYQIINILEQDGRIQTSSDSIYEIEEGTLFPSTYNFYKNDSTKKILSCMQHTHKQVLEKMWEEREINPNISSAKEALILASIIQKEAGPKDDMRRIAAVFINRLNIGMKLDSDPTVIFGISDGYGAIDGNLTKKDLKIKNKFNTYYIKKLPESAICNPGAHAIFAALHPLKTKELYFVSNKQGSHLFSRTLKEHINNIKEVNRK